MITAEPTTRNAASFRDPSGFVFEHDGRVFRAVDDGCMAEMRELSEGGLLEELVDAGHLVPTRIIDDPLEHYALAEAFPGHAGFLEHRRVEYLSYPYEWSFAMLVDAGLLTLDLQVKLLQKGHSLKDATAYNVQFVTGRPVFIDVASIERPNRQDVWIALGQFGRMFTLPLLLNHKKGHQLRAYFLANLDGRDVADVRAAFNWMELFRPSLLLDITLPYWLARPEARTDKVRHHSDRTGRTPKQAGPSAQIMNLKRLRAKLQRLRRRHQPSGHWSNYTQTCSYTDAAEGGKMDAVKAFLGVQKPATVLDLGCNTGQYSVLAAEIGATVIAVDADPDVVDTLYRHVHERRLPILPLCIDIANPSPAIGFCNRERTRFMERARAECVLALALIHHLHVSANLPFNAICDLLAQLTTDTLVLEFVPQDDVMFRRLMRFRVDLYQDYTLEKCMKTFSERFELICRVPVPDSPRTLLFWKKT